MTLEQIKIMTCGNVDDGKSTLLGKIFLGTQNIYEDQLKLMQTVQLKRNPFDPPKLHINCDIKTLEDIETWVTLDDFKLEGYRHHDPIVYPFSV